jgi:hypothetical protein
MVDAYKDDAPKGPQRIEVGGTGTLTVKFKDAFDKEAKPTSVNWSSSSGNVTVSPDEKDPTKAKIFAVESGPAVITAQGFGEDGRSASVLTSVVATEKGSLASGEITVAVQPAPEKKKAEPVKEEKEEKREPAHAGAAHR